MLSKQDIMKTHLVALIRVCLSAYAKKLKTKKTKFKRTKRKELFLRYCVMLF